MFKNYLSIALNNLIKHKLYSMINIIGLAIGLAACILITLYVQDETSYDKHWENSDQLYRVNTAYNIPGRDFQKITSSSLLAAPRLQDYFSEEIEFSAREITNTTDIFINTENGASRFQESISEVDRDFIEMFDFDVLSGNLVSTMESTSNIALSEKLAIKFFGLEEAVGQIISLQNSDTNSNVDYVVGAVYRLPTGNTVLDLSAIRLFDETVQGAYLMDWGVNFCVTYLQLFPGVNLDLINSRLAAFTNQTIPNSEYEYGQDNPGEIISFDLQNIEGLYLDSPFDLFRTGGDKNTVMAFSVIATLVLLIGSMNFMILTTAKATQRAKEVAMRKLLGARRGQLIIQFLGESFFIVALSMLLALGVVELMLPIFESFTSKELSVVYSSPQTYLSFIGLLVLVGLVGGLYPAFILSNLRPSSNLKSTRSSESKGSLILRNALVIFQFSVSIALFIAAIVIYAQIQYAGSRDPGFNKENLIVIDDMSFRPDVKALQNTLTQQISNLANVSNVSQSVHEPTQLGGYASVGGNYTAEGLPGESTLITTLGIDNNFFETYQIPIVAGRNYDLAGDQRSSFFPSDSTSTELSNVVINERAARQLGFLTPQEAIGKQIKVPNLAGRTINLNIIGVVADTQFSSLRTVPRAEVYVLSLQAGVTTVRYQGDPQSMVSQIQDIWDSVMGDAVMSSSFVDQLMAKELEQERTEAQILINFSLLAIVIACLGLYGSSSFTVDRRTKEIGLRKVMGAKVKQIVKLLLWQFSKPVLFANIIAWPVAVYFMLSWLERFPYQIAIWLLIPFCLASGLIALAIAWITVAINTSKVARTNPIHALRYE